MPSAASPAARVGAWLKGHPYYAVAALILVGISVQFWLRQDSEWMNVYVRAAQRLLRGEDLYCDGYLYPPFMAGTALPFAGLHPRAVRALWLAASWSVDYFVVTSRRMILTSGLLTRKVAMMPLNKVTDMSFQRTFPGRLFGYGEFILESAGQDQALRNIPYIPYPEQLYLEVCDLLFPSKDDGDD